MIPRPARCAMLAAVAALALACPACWPFTTRDSTRAGSTTPMPGAEARLLLIQARERLHANRAGDMWRAVELANDIIARCERPKYVQYVWEAYIVKVSAFEAAGYSLAAARAARDGIEAILHAQPGPPVGATLTALKILLPLYVERAAASRDYEDPHKALQSWKADLLARYARLTDESPDAPAMREEFALLEQMADEQLSAREPETRILRTVQQYVRALTARDADALRQLLDPQSALAARLADAGPAALLPAGAEQAYLASGVRIEMAEKSRAAAGCSVVTLSRGGWARVADKVLFSLTCTASGEWRIEDVSGLR